MTRSLHDFATILDNQRGTVRRRVRAVRPNHASVVVWVRVAGHAMLFGADLEMHADAGLGWGALVANPGRPHDRAEFYKVAHHGSPNGDSPEIWSDLLLPRPVACLTPFARGRRPRPQPDDVQRICDRASQLYMTAPPRRPATVHRRAPVERTIREVVGKLWRAEPNCGAIRCTPDPDAPGGWAAELFEPAFAACPDR